MASIGPEDYVNHVMSNMQILHECKDSRDEHFSRQQSHNANLKVSRELHGDRVTNDDFMTENISDEDLLLHIESIDDCQSNRQEDHQQAADSLLAHTDSVGLFALASSEYSTETEEQQSVQWLAEDDCELETVWADAYEQHRLLNKQRRQAGGSVELVQMASSGTDVQDGSAF